ncbi:hypothetical protein [Stenotrophomonas sp.]|uniref:hypothetical protein n=1 Tax=Stenotrophomonas sp. TaxID=69392 RepID=UPI0028AA7288|nr:hypothetical protein [Stenotrophomonas sp.]
MHDKKAAIPVPSGLVVVTQAGKAKAGQVHTCISRQPTWATKAYAWLHDKAPYPINRVRALLERWMAKQEAIDLMKGQLGRIETKLDQLIEALADDDLGEVQNVVSVSLSGEPLGRERDQTQGLS